MDTIVLNMNDLVCYLATAFVAGIAATAVGVYMYVMHATTWD